MPTTYTAFNGQKEYRYTLPSGEIRAGLNQPDQSIVGFITHQTDGQRIVDFLQVNHISPEGVMRAYSACGRNDAHELLNYPQVMKWYSNFLVPKTDVTPVVTPVVQAPVAPVVQPQPAVQPTVQSLAAEGEALLKAVAAYVARVNLTLK